MGWLCESAEQTGSASSTDQLSCDSDEFMGVILGGAVVPIALVSAASSGSGTEELADPSLVQGIMSSRANKWGCIGGA